MNLQVSMGVGLNKLSHKEANTSIFGGKHELGLISAKADNSTNVSLQIEKSTSNQNYDLGRSIKVPKNVSLEIVNSTSQQYDWGLSSKGSNNVSLQVENSTSFLPSSGQHAEKPSKNSFNLPICLQQLWVD